MSELDNSQRPVSTDSVEVPIRVVDFPDYGVYRLPLIIEQVVDISVPLIRCKTYGGKVCDVVMPSFVPQNLEVGSHVEAVALYKLDEETGSPFYEAFVTVPIGPQNIERIKKVIEMTLDPRFATFFSQFQSTK